MSAVVTPTASGRVARLVRAIERARLRLQIAWAEEDLELMQVLREHPARLRRRRLDLQELRVQLALLETA